MGKQRSTLARNATYLTIASVLQKAITFGYYGYLAGAIGSQQLGKYTFALTVSSVFVIFMDCGLGTLLTREVAKKEESLQSVFNRFLSVKILLILFTLLVFILLIHGSDAFFQNIDGLDVQLLYIAAAIIVFDTLSFTAFSVLRALQKLQWEAMGIVLYQLTIVSCGIIAISNGLPLTVILSALLGGSIVQCFFIWGVMKRVAKIRFTFQLQKKDIFSLVSLAAPFAIAGIIFRLTGSVDAVLLKLYLGDEAAGWYGLAFKLTFALMVIPGSYATSFYPAMSDYIQHAKEKTGPLFQQSLLYMLIASAPIMGGVLVVGDTLIRSVWEDFEPSILPLSIFMLSLPFLFLNYPIGNLLNAANQQKRNTVNMLIALVVNVVLNIALIPFYTVNGSAFAATVSAVVLVILGFPTAYRYAPFPWKGFLQKIVGVAVATAVMMGGVWYVEPRVHLFVAIMVGMILYTSALFLFRVLSVEEMRSIIRSILKKS